MDRNAVAKKLTQLFAANGTSRQAYKGCGKGGNPMVSEDLIKERLRLLEDYISDLTNVQNISLDKRNKNGSACIATS